MQLRGSVVVITGASSGIGLATAQAFARGGARLVLAARRADALDRAAASCHELGAEALAVPADVTDAAALERLAAAAVERFGRIDLWFNNVGVGSLGRFRDVPLAEHRRVVEANLIGTMNGCYAALPVMLQAERGTIINMASIGGYLPTPFATSYAASKFGIAGFTDSLRFELKAYSGIEVCGVYPGFVDTPAHHHAGNHTGRSLTWLKPSLDPEDVAARIVGLARRPRRSLHIGVPPGAPVLGALIPDAAGRAFGRIAQRVLMGTGEAAAPTGGALLEPVAEGVGLRGEWERQGRSSHVLGLTAAVGVAALALMLLGKARA